jgi:capsular polysaccharide biosynthesis protein
MDKRTSSPLSYPYIEALRRSWAVPVILAVLTMLIGLGLELLIPPSYEAEATFVISPASELLDAPLDEIIFAIDKINIEVVSTYVEILGSRLIRVRASETLDMDGSQMAQYSTHTISLPSSNVLAVRVVGPDAELVAQLANEVGIAGALEAESLYGIYSLTALDPARVPQQPIGRGLLEEGLAALVIGGLTGAFGVLALAHWRQIRARP